MSDQTWMPNPPDGTLVCAGFDGSENDDWTAIKLETIDGLIFTPRYSDGKPTIWNPANWGGRTPRGEINAAWDELSRRYKIKRAYCDPGFRDESSWATEIEEWDLAYPDTDFVPWVMAGQRRIDPVYKALRRFEADLEAGRITHDGCPITTTHMGNVRRLAKPGDRYILGKPAQTQKIDAAVTSVLAHEAAADARADGWAVESGDKRVFFFN